MVPTLFSWALFSLIVGALGTKRKIGFRGAFFVSILLTPFIGAIFVATSKELNFEEIKKEIESRHPCSFCKEMIKKSAKKCHFCGSEVLPDVNYLKEMEEDKLIDLRKKIRESVDPVVKVNVGMSILYKWQGKMFLNAEEAEAARNSKIAELECNILERN